MQVTNISVIYFIFRLILLVVGALNGYYLSKKSKKKSVWGFYPVIGVYTLYSGLRWGRGTDYNLYYWVYEDINNGISREDYEPLFELMVKIGGWLGLSWQGFVVFMSFFLIFAWCFFLKDYKQYLLIGLPFLCLNLTFAENFMRWSLGFSFILIGLSYILNRGDYKKYVIFCLMAFFIHYGLILNILLFTGIYFIKKPFSPLLFFLIYVGGIMLFSASFFTNFIDLVQQANLGTRFITYQANAAMWLDPEDQKEQGDFSYYNILATLFFILSANKMIKKKPKWLYIYNLSLIACVGYPISQKLELLIRMEDIIYIFRTVLLGFVILDVLKNKKYYGRLMYMFAVLFLIYNLYSYTIRASFMFSDPLYYIWDAHGRRTLF